MIVVILETKFDKTDPEFFISLQFNCLQLSTLQSVTSVVELKKAELIYSHLSNNRGGWNNRGEEAKIATSLNVEVGKYL